MEALSPSKVDALIGLGSSLGDRHAHVRLAIAALHADVYTEVVRVSSLVWSRGLGSAKGPFLNGVVRLRTHHEPLGLLSLCKSIERRLKRRPAQRWGDRTIDLDVLLWHDAAVQLPHLVVPHAQMLSRAFVVVPAKEVGGDMVHPLRQQLVSELDVPSGMRVWSASGVGGRLAGLRRVRYCPAPGLRALHRLDHLGDSP